jgi:hypothetical protein
VTKARPPYARISFVLFERALEEGGKEFAERLRFWVEFNRRESSLPPDETFKPSKVRKQMERLQGAGEDLLNSVFGSYDVIRANMLAERLVTEGSVTDDGGVPPLLIEVHKHVTDLMKLAARIRDSQPRVQTTYGGRPVALGVLRCEFQQYGIPWTSTCPIDPDDPVTKPSLAVEAVAAGFGITNAAASKAIQRMDKCSA